MANPYLEMELRTASPEALVGRLLDRAVASVRSGVEHLDRDPVDATQTIARAVDIVSELRGALDIEVGGDTARNLDALYEFVSHRLVLGRASGDARELGEALRVLEVIAGAWAELLEQRAGSA